MPTNMVKGFNVGGSTVQYDYDSLGNKLEKTSIAREYSNIDTYDIDEYVIYNGRMYKCKQKILVGESFDSTKWTECSIGPELNYIKNFIGFSEDAKYALLNLLAHVAYTDEHGQEYLDELEEAMFQTARIVSITVEFEPGDIIFCAADSLNSLREYLTVTATYEDLTTKEITSYSLDGSMSAGTNTITVSYQGQSDTFDVTVRSATKLFVGATYGKTQSGGTVTPDNNGGGTMITTGDTASNYGTSMTTTGSASVFKTYSVLKGHRIRAYIKATWTATTETSMWTIAPYFSSTISTSATRLKFKSACILHGEDFDGFKDIVIPTNFADSDWSGSGTVLDSSYFEWRCYLLSSTAGANMTFTSEWYDLGVDEQ